MSKDQEEQGFRVTDKRPFSEDGELRQEDVAEEVHAKERTEPANSAGEARSIKEAAEAKIDFPSYILSYYTQGLVLLGEVPNPYTNKKEEDVNGAHHIVDILEMLKEKTKGNLAKEEEKLIESVLYELRIKFMAKTNKIKL